MLIKLSYIKIVNLDNQLIYKHHTESVVLIHLFYFTTLIMNMTYDLTFKIQVYN